MFELALGSYRRRHFLHGMPLLAYFVFAATVSLEPDDHVSLCMLKKLIDIPCPFCGLTRALGNLFHGNAFTAWLLSPAALLFFPSGIALIAYRITCILKPRLIRIPLTWELAFYYSIFLLFIMVWIIRLCFQ